MRRLVPLLVSIAVAANLCGAVVDLTPERGRAVPSINWIDETGRNRLLSEFSGYPLILLPIYTRCRGACVQDVDRLKEALAGSFVDPRQFRVLLFSFDATDNPAVLARYRQRQNISLGWSIGSASQTNIDALLELIGFQVGKAGTEFMHPNMLVFVDSKLRVAKWIYGTDYSARDVDRALQAALGKGDWIGQHSDFVYAILLFSASLLCVALLQQVLLRRNSMQSRGRI